MSTLLPNRLNKVAMVKNRVADENRPTSVGAVTRGQVMPSSTPFPDLISFGFDNSAGTSAKNYVLFDALGICVALKGGSYNQADTTSGASVPIVKASVQQNPLVFSAFGYRITTGTTAQFAQSFLFSKGAIDGTYMQKPIRLEKGIRNSQFQDKILTIEQEMVVDQYTALFLTVAAGTAVSIDFWVSGQINVL